ncbi:MAG: hypothetical protein JNN28_04385 [Saprospiraceae bacterium]|nr:hypothetical protein [Saprospiraceae bacterium]
MKRSTAIITLFTIFCFILNVNAQKISNVKWEAEGNKIVITFDLTGASPHKKLWVKPGLVIGTSPIDYLVMKSMDGDTGLIINQNGGKQIVWDAYKDVKSLPPDFRIEIDLKTAWKVPAVHAISFSGNTLAPVGLKYQYLGLNGFYLGGKVLNFQFPKSIGHSGDLTSGLLNAEKPYKYVSAVRQSYCVSGGYIHMLLPELYLYTGAGYGIDRTFWEITALDGDLSPSGDTFWVTVNEENQQSKGTWLIEAGVNAKLKRLILDAGIGMLGKNQVFVNFGLGYVLSRNTITK